MNFNPLADPCLSCGLWRGKKHPCIRPKEARNEEGKDRSRMEQMGESTLLCERGKRIVLVGEAPGEEEDNQGKAFVGRSGRVLRSILAELGVTNRVTFLNAVRCRPVNSSGGDRAPSVREVLACRGFTTDDLMGLNPRGIVLMGRMAAASFGFSGKSLLELRHKQFWAGPPDWMAKTREETNGLLICTTASSSDVRPGSGNRDDGSPHNLSLLNVEGCPQELATERPERGLEPTNGEGGYVPLWVTYHPAAGLRAGKVHLIKELRDDLAMYVADNTRNDRQGADSRDNNNCVQPVRLGTGKMVAVDIETSGFLKDGKALPFSDEAEILLTGWEEL